MAKAGRKRKTGVLRTKSGRISRAAGTYQENVPQIETRMRLFGLTEVDARDQKAATFIGRMRLGGELSEAQYDAAVEMLDVRDRYKRAISAPDAFRNSASPAGSDESLGHTAWCKGAIERWDAAKKAVLHEQGLFPNRGTNLFAALDYLLYRDQPFEHMVGDLRIALNALAHHFRAGKPRPSRRMALAA